MTMKSPQTVLVLVAHTDDETLGVGGTIARHVSLGDKVFAISMTDGVGARQGMVGPDAQRRNEAALRAAKILGFEWIEGGEFPDNGLDRVALLDVVRLIERVKIKLRPTLIYTHSAADLNVDHRIVAQATLTAFRPQPNEEWTEIRTFEVPSATDYGHPEVTTSFAPNLSIAIEKTWPQKLAALQEYSLEMRESPHSRSYDGVKILAQYRGHQVGLPMAEAFQILRKIER